MPETKSSSDRPDEKGPTFAEVQAAQTPAQAPVDPNAGVEVRRYRPNVMRSEAPPKEDELTAAERRAGGPVYVVEVDQWGHDEGGKALFKGDLFMPGDLDPKSHDVAFALRTGAVRRAPEHAAAYAAQK